MGRLILTIGISGSGKSTWAEKFAAENGFFYLSSDEVRERICGNANDQSKNQTIFQIIFSIINNLLTKNDKILFDATNYSRKNRKEIIKIAQKHGALIEARVFMTSLEVCLDRNFKRSRVVPTEVIERQHKNFQYPTFEEGFTIIENVL